MKGLVGAITDTAIKLGSKAKFKLVKASPELLIGGGVACIIVATVMACKATKKAEEVLEESRERLDGVEEAERRDLDLTEGEALAEKRRIKLRTAGHLVRIYGPSVALGIAGVAMIFTSHGIMKKRNGAILAAYNALDAAFKQYRERVLAEEDGKERDKRYLYGDQRNSMRSLADDMNEEAMIIAHQRNPWGPYIYEFSKETSVRWSAHPFSNLNIIKEVEDWATRQLERYRFLFVNDVLKELGMSPVPWGQFIGWSIDYGESAFITILREEDKDRLDYDAVNDVYGNPIMLEFNCDGLIWEMLG